MSADLLADGVVAMMLGGLSTRGYRMGLEPVGQQVEQAATGTSHSAVSRWFMTATAERLDQLLQRPLGAQWWLVVFLDGFGTGGHEVCSARIQTGRPAQYDAPWPRGCSAGARYSSHSARAAL